MKNNIDKKIEISIQELLYLIFLAIMFIVKGLGLYDGQFAYKILFEVSFLILGLKMILTDYTWKEWIVIVLLGIMVIVMNRCSGEKGPLIIYAILIGIKNVSLEKCMQVGAWSLGISSIAVVIFNLFTTPNSNCFYVTERLGLKIGRWPLGYPHPNSTAVTYLAIVTMILFLLKENYNKRHFFLLLFGNVIINFYCVSFTGFIVCTLYICVAYYFIRINTKVKFWRIIISLYSFFCMFIFMIIPFVLPQSVLAFLEKYAFTLYHRLILSKIFFNRSTVSFWGVHAADLTDSVYTLDNSYLYSIVFNGVIFSVIVFVLYLYVIQVLLKEEKQIELLIILALMTEGIMEPFLFNTSFKNTSLFIVGAVIWEIINQKIRQEKKLGLHYKKTIQLPIMNISWRSIFDKEYRKKIFIRVGLLGVIYCCLFFFLQRYWLPEYVINSTYVGTRRNIQFLIEYARKVVSWLVIAEVFWGIYWIAKNYYEGIHH